MSFEVSTLVFLMSVFGEDTSAEVILLTTFIASTLLLGCYQILLKTFQRANLYDAQIPEEVSEYLICLRTF